MDAVGRVYVTYLLCEGVGTIVLWDGGGSCLSKRLCCGMIVASGRYVSVLCVCWVGLLVGLRVEEMLLAYCLAFSFNLSVMCGSRLCLPCTFCWLVLWGSGKLGSRCEFRKASMAVVWGGRKINRWL